MSYQKKPEKFLALHFKLHGGVVESRETRGTTWRFPDGRTFFVHSQPSVRKAQSWVSFVKDTYPYAQRSLNPHERARTSGRAPILDLDRRALHASDHAKARFALMAEQAGVDWPEVDLALRAPVRVTFNEKHNSWVWVGERVAVALYERPGGYVISTLLWATTELFDKYPRPEGTDPS